MKKSLINKTFYFKDDDTHIFDKFSKFLAFFNQNFYRIFISNEFFFVIGRHQSATVFIKNDVTTTGQNCAVGKCDQGNRKQQ